MFIYTNQDKETQTPWHIKNEMPLCCRTLNNPTKNCLRSAVLIVGSGNVFGGGAGFRFSIAHRDGNTGNAQHGNIVEVIADCHDIRERNAQGLSKFGDPDTFCDGFAVEF